MANIHTSRIIQNRMRDKVKSSESEYLKHFVTNKRHGNRFRNKTISLLWKAFLYLTKTTVERFIRLRLNRGAINLNKKT